MYDLKFSILLPTYKGAAVVGETLRSILFQSFDNYEIIVHEDASDDNIEEVIGQLGDDRIKFFRNEKNVGYPKNLEMAMSKSTGDIIYLMGQDDILGMDALLNTYRAFKISDDIGAVARPYFWFDKMIDFPVRAKQQIDPAKDTIIKITDDTNLVIGVVDVLDQLSGLAYRKRYLDMPFQESIFTSHIYPFLSIFTKHPIVFLKDYNIAVRMATSMSRTISSTYEKSPLQSWVEMIKFIFEEEKYKKIGDRIISDFVAKNYVGLVQIRNYAKYKYLLREIWLLIKYRWWNIFNPYFWFFSIGCIIMPARLLIPLVGWYKNEINSKKIPTINFQYKL